MKRLSLGLLLLGVFISVRADEILKNSDFSDGLANWEGAGETAAAASENVNPLPLTDPQSKLGILIKLDAREWTKFSQKFPSPSSQAGLKIIYRCSKDIAFSTDYENYRDAPELLGYDPRVDFSGEPGDWMVLLKSHHILRHYLIAPKPGTDLQTFEVDIKHLNGEPKNVISLAFPPGNGTVTLLHVGLESEPDSDAGDKADTQ